MPSLNALRAFEAAGRLGRMNAAADELSVTHGAVSYQISRLEEYLGLKLFDGPRKSPVLTQEGAALLPRLTVAFDQIEAVVRDVRRPDYGTIDVSCLSSFMMRWLIPRLYRFKAQHPGLNVRLSGTDRHLDMERGSLDVVISVGDGTDPRLQDLADAVHVDLFPEELGPVLAPGLAAMLALESPATLPAAMLLRTKTRPDAWEVWATRHGLKPPIPEGPEFEHYYFSLEAASAGLGICLTPRHLVARDIADNRLVAPFGFLTSGKRYFALYRKRRGAGAAQFCAWLQREAASD
ncbi:LysR substrate-binding domain-containing protein [Microvirga pudoricolor]|uniref:LysR substrate-binding domain-containing protein n=1 Tax=Microvirga pudoricolor TaxID=2778729 RepID=UPI00195053D3|nr:LysR substrate-binding domain-containing protein [Microvirga pudoricolor]MBM6594186.1 LysR family transcriptional regulator [Microvirga pudoricolor]